MMGRVRASVMVAGMAEIGLGAGAGGYSFIMIDGRTDSWQALPAA
jgi:hypothetical protein